MNTRGGHRPWPEGGLGRPRSGALGSGLVGSHGRGSDVGGPVRLSEALDQFMGWIKKPPADVLVVVFNNWEEVVGPDVARHCHPVAIDANRLVVSADDPMWADELRWNSEKVLSRLVEVSGDRSIEKLIVRVGYHSQRDGG